MSRIYTINYTEKTYTLEGKMNETEVEITTKDVNKVVNTIKVACIGPSIKEKITIDIEEVM